VPGPQFALYMAGAKMLTYYPVSIAVHSVALNITVESYNGSLDFGLTACRRALPDLPHLARYMQAAHKELLVCTPAETPPPSLPETKTKVVRRRAAAPSAGAAVKAPKKRAKAAVELAAVKSRPQRLGRARP